jgi:4-diphosphocytidyl-2-C-methyl-D-erythritol kinase
MPSDRPTAVQAKAPAKINLTLHVLGRLPDGYHELRTMFQSLALSDTLTFQVRPGPFEIVCTDPGCPSDETNLVWRAGDRLWQAAGRHGVPRDVLVHIKKEIPVRAGLGGGSSDAGAAIRALSLLWGLRLRLHLVREIARGLGADVPFFLVGGTAVGVGRGDELVVRAETPPATAVVVVPPFGVSTSDAYRWWDEARRPSNRAVRHAVNDLEAPVVARHPEVGQLVRTLRRYGARRAAMSGSGSAVFGLFSRRVDAERVVSEMADGGKRVILTRTVTRSGYARLVRPRACTETAAG